MYNDCLNGKKNIEQDRQRGGGNFIVMNVGDYNYGWPIELWHPKGDEHLPREWMPITPTERQHAIMGAMKSLRLEPPGCVAPLKSTRRVDLCGKDGFSKSLGLALRHGASRAPQHLRLDRE